MRWVVVIMILFSCTSTRETLVKLDGSASFDPDGYITKYEWRQIRGRPGKIANANSPVTTTKIKERGIYAWELVVTDNAGAQARDTTSINKK